MNQNDSLSVKGLVNVLGGGAIAALVLALLVLFLLNVFV